MDTNGLIYYGCPDRPVLMTISQQAVVQMLVYPNERDAGSDNVIDKMLGEVPWTCLLR